ncbi:MAG TPA: hypothetical protein VG406_26720 [Isosphaeraceae bacterium]|jgi:Tol biopolymer transport system component|nr:hypothetical protein [Isosphaeraceae bacterium]
MTSRFGPWTTGLGDDIAPALSTFWRRRLSRLADARRGKAALSRRDLLRLGAVGVGAAALPAFRVGPAGIARADEKEKGPTGLIYARTLFNGPDPANPNINCPVGIGVFPVAGGQTQTILDKLTDVLRVSPDGKTIAYGLEGATWTIDAKGEQEPRKVADFAASPFWSPDGKELILARAIRQGDDPPAWTMETYRLKLGGGEPVKLDIPKDVNVFDWSRDGNWLAATKGSDIDVLRPDGTELRKVNPKKGALNSPRISPDGKRVAYCEQGGTECLWTIGIDGKDQHKVYEQEDVVSNSCAWSPDGKYLVAAMFTWQHDEKGRKFLSIGQGESRLEVMTAEGKDATRITPPVIDVIWPDWH